MQLAKVMPVLDIARLVGEHDTLIWWMVNHYVDMARSKADHSAVTQVGMDETAARRGHDYVSLFVEFSVESGRLDIYLDFARGSTFACPERLPRHTIRTN